MPFVAVETLQGADGFRIGFPADEGGMGQRCQFLETGGADDADGGRAVVSGLGVPVFKIRLGKVFQGRGCLAQVVQCSGVYLRHAGADYLGGRGDDGLCLVFQFVGHFGACHVAVLKEDEVPLFAFGQGEGGGEVDEFEFVVAVGGNGACIGFAGLSVGDGVVGIRVLQRSCGQPGGAVREDEQAVAAGRVVVEDVVQHLCHDGGIGGVLLRVSLYQASGAAVGIGYFNELRSGVACIAVDEEAVVEVAVVGMEEARGEGGDFLLYFGRKAVVACKVGYEDAVGRGEGDFVLVDAAAGGA